MQTRILAVGAALAALTAPITADAFDSPKYGLDLTGPGFVDVDTYWSRTGRQLIDIEARWTGDQTRYTGIWAEVDGTAHRLIQGSSADWSAFIAENRGRRGRFVDVEVGYFDGQKRYSAIFLEDGDDYGFELRTTCTDAQFQQYQASNRAAGRRLIDFEAYTVPGGDIRYAGVWVEDPNQPMTATYYGLQSPDVSDLIRPLHGRIIDFERYYSPVHGEDRYALVFAQVPASTAALWRNFSRNGFTAKVAEEGAAGRDLIDIDVWTTAAGSVRYSGVWGQAPKSLWTVDGPDAEPDRQDVPATLANRIAATEGATAARVGFYARNVRTGQTMGYRDGELFYLASVAKLVPHFRLWRAFQTGELDPTDTIQYRLDDWHVDDRTAPGLTTCQCRNLCFDNNGVPTRFPDSWNAITLDRLDRAMMQVSDNAATSMLVSDPTLGLAERPLDLNEWLAAIPGAGRGWGPVTSILDVDRDIMWNGQVMNRPDETSVFGAPTAALEPRWRNCAAGDDPWGYLADEYPGGAPSYTSSTGHRRYYNQGQNNAEPRAVGALLSRVMEGAVLDDVNLEGSLAAMRTGGPLDAPALPNQIETYTKGGAKGSTNHVPSTATRSEAGVLRVGDESVVIGVFAEGVTNTNAWTTLANTASVEAARALFPDLHDLDADATAWFDDSDREPGDGLAVLTAISNTGAANSPAFNVRFYLSRNTTITTSDHLVGSLRVGGVAGDGTRGVYFRGTVPANLAAGTWYFGWIIDPGNPGEVGEFDEGNNTAVLSSQPITVR